MAFAVGADKRLSAQTALQASKALPDFVIPYRNLDGVPIPDEHDDLPGTRHRRIEQVALEQNFVLPKQRHNDDWILSALRFMDRGGVGQLEIIEEIPAVDDLTQTCDLLIAHGQRL